MGRSVIGGSPNPARRRACHALSLLVAALAWAMACAVGAQAQPAGNRIALVVGNGAYQSVGRLANPGNDAKLVASTLKSEGFRLIGGDAQLNLDKAHFDKAVADFGRAIDHADVALFYYSGHGLQVDGINFLVPVDANPTRRQDLDFQMVKADLVLSQMSDSGTKLNIIILDACRNNPFAGTVRAAGGGLAEMKAPEGTLISYATQPGSVASDGTGQDSPFTLSLVSALRQPGLDIFNLFNHVGLEVKKATDGSQQPWLSASPIEGQFTFNPLPTAPAPAPAVVASLPAETGPADAKSTNGGHVAGNPGSGRPASIVTGGLVAPLHAPAVPEHPANQFLCPAKDWTVYGEDETMDWNGDAVTVRRVNSGWFWHSLGADPANASMCLHTGRNGAAHRLVQWFDTDQFDVVATAGPAMLALVEGKATEATAHFARRTPAAGSTTPGSYDTSFRVKGHESFDLGGHSYDTLVIDFTETNARGTTTGTGRTWFAPQLGLFVRKVWRPANGGDVTGFSIVGLSTDSSGKADMAGQPAQ